MEVLARDILLTFVGIIIVILVNTHRKDTKMLSVYNIGLIIFSISIVIVFSLTGISPTSGLHTDIRIDEINLVPFASIAVTLKGMEPVYILINILGNILMFAPLGFLIPLLFPNYRSFKKTVLVGFLTSLLIECTQLFLIRGTDIDDLLLNTLGAMLGYLVYIVFKKLISKLHQTISFESDKTAGTFLMVLCIIIPYTVCILDGFYIRFIYFLN